MSSRLDLAQQWKQAEDNERAASTALMLAERDQLIHTSYPGGRAYYGEMVNLRREQLVFAQKRTAAAKQAYEESFK